MPGLVPWWQQPISLSRTALATAAALTAIGAVYVLRTPPQQGDPDFDARVATPACTTNHPRVYFDESHGPQGLYQPFLDLVRNDGYLVGRRQGQLTRKALTGFDILVLTIAMGFKEGVKTLPGLRHNLKGDAFTPEECTVVKNWIDTGGALLLASDYAPTAKSADRLAREFGITFLDGWAIEPNHHDTASGRLGFIVFSRANGQLAEHPVTRSIDRVMSFTGQAMLFPESGTPFLKLSPEARVAPYRENEPRREPAPAAGAAQGVALETGRGRVVVLGEATMLTSVLVRANGSTQHLGMGHAGCDDRQLTLNIMHWLSRL
jgi:hypothetical protein